MKNKYPVVGEEEKKFSFNVKAKVLHQFRIEAAKRGMSTGKLIGMLITSYINSLDN